MPKLTELPKRILIGRALRSDRLGETLLPKRLALPVFASDPLSSVAYAPGEVLLVLSVAGAATYRFSPWIAVAVVVLLMAWGFPVHGAAVAVLLAVQVLLMTRLLKAPRERAPWFNATGTSLYVIGMLVTAFALAGGA